MRKLRKAISFMLVFTLLFSVTAFSETRVKLTDISEDTVVGRAVTELVKLNIIDGYEDNTFKPDNTITRGEFSKIVATFLNMAHLGSDTLDSGFEDVDKGGGDGKGHWAKKYIKLAVDRGIVNGYPEDDGTFTFRPDDPVKYVEAVKMLVSALNYGVIAENRTTPGAPWYQGYLTVAAERGILNSASVNNYEDPASRGIVAILTYNCLEVPLAEVSPAGKVTIGSGSVIKDVIGKEKIVGVVIGVEQTGLYTGASGLTKREIIVRTSDGDRTVRTPLNYDNNSILGYRISGYVEAGMLRDEENITDISKERQNELTVIKPENLDDVSVNSVSYYPDENSAVRRSLSFDKDMAVIYNGKALSDWTPDDMKNVKSGRIELLDNDGDGNIEVAFITSYEIFVVSSANKQPTNGPVTVYPLYGEKSFIIPNEEVGYIYSFTNSSTKAEFNPRSITKWDIISLLRSKESSEGKAVFEALVTRNKVSGTIKEVSGKTIKIDNKYYTYAYNFDEYSGTNKPNFDVNMRATVYLDHEGKIAAAESTSQDISINAGMLVNAGKESGIGNKAEISLYGISGVIGKRQYSLAAKTRIDGKLISDYEEMLTILRDAATNVNKGKEVDKALMPTSYSQLIRYTLNSAGEVDMIDTAEPNVNVTSDDITKSITSYPAQYEDGAEPIRYRYVSGGRFQDEDGGTLMQAGSGEGWTTRVIEVPDDMSNIDAYSVGSYSSIFSNSVRYKVEAYNLSSVFVARYILVFKGDDVSTFNEGSPFVIVDKTVSSGGEDGPQDKVFGWNMMGASLGENGVLSETEGMLRGKYEAGEIFRYITNSKDEIKEVQNILKIENSKPVLLYGTTENMLAPVASSSDAVAKRIKIYDDGGRTPQSSKNRFIYGTVLGREGNTITITPLISTDEAEVDDIGAYKENFNISESVKVFYYDLTTSKIENRVMENASIDNIESVHQLKDSSRNIDEATQVLIYTRDGSVRTIIIFKY